MTRDPFELLTQAGPLVIAPRYLTYMLDVVQGRRQPTALRASVLQGRRLVGAEVIDGIAVVPVTGPILQRADAFGAFGAVSVSDLRATIGAAIDDPGVDGVLLVVDSPGGEVAGVADLADELYEARKRKPMMAVADEGIYSAAYWLASAVGPISLPRTGGVGSIGALIVHTDMSDALTQMGVRISVIKSGKRKSLFSAFQPLSEEARAALQAEVNRVADLFITAAARHRGLDAGAVWDFEGGTFEGQAALDAGLADRLETVEAAYARFRAQIPRHGARSEVKQMAFNEQPPAGTTASTATVAVAAETPAAPAPPRMVDLEAARKSAREEAIAAERVRNVEITRWCTLLGKADLAEGFIQSDKSVEAVQAELLLQTASAGFEIQTTRPVGSSRTFRSTDEIYESRRQQIAAAKRTRVG